MARDDPKAMRRGIRNDGRPIPQEYHSPRGELPRNLGNFTHGSQILDTQVLMWQQGAKLPILTWLDVFALVYVIILSIAMDENNVQLICMNATTIVTSVADRVMERGALGPVFKSLTVAHFRHFATVFGFIPYLRLSVASGACDSCIAAPMACVAPFGFLSFQRKDRTVKPWN